MIIGQHPVGRTPFGSDGTDQTRDTGTAAEIVFSGGTPVFAEIIVADADMEAGGLVFSSNTTRVGAGTTGTAAAVIFTGGTGSVGIASSPSATTLTFSSGETTATLMLVPTGASFALSGGDGAVGVAAEGIGSSITFTGGAVIPMSALNPTGAGFTISGGSAQVGLVAEAAAGSFAFSGGTPVLAIRTAVPTALIWLSGGSILESEESSQGLVVVLNANTLAVSEYDIEDVLDVVEHGGEVYFITPTGIKKMSSTGDEVFDSELRTGQLDFGNTIGKRCPTVSLNSGNDSIPDVSIIDDALVEYPAAIKQGYTDKYTRMYNTPRGVLATRIGYLIKGPALNFTEIKAEVITSATR